LKLASLLYRTHAGAKWICFSIFVEWLRRRELAAAQHFVCDTAMRSRFGPEITFSAFLQYNPLAVARVYFYVQHPAADVALC
jgi:hypothetical protein